MLCLSSAGQSMIGNQVEEVQRGLKVARSGPFRGHDLLGDHERLACPPGCQRLL
jgi:hypothetical protein